jgi:hypothetical protein
MTHKLFHKLFLAGAAVGLACGCASHESARERETNMRVDMACINGLQQYTCGYRPQAHASTCAPSLPHGYSKDSGGYRRPSAVHQSPEVKRLGPVVKAYEVEPLVDPSDPRIVHGRHIAYRLEASPSWQYQTSVQRREHRAEYAPDLLPTEVTRDVIAAKQGAQKASEEVAELNAKIEVFSDALKGNAGATNANQLALAKEVVALKDKVAHLEGRAAAVPASPPPAGQAPTSGIRVPGGQP